MAFKYHVTCQGGKKIICPAEKNKLYSEIKMHLGLSEHSRIIVQWFEDEWQDWVDAKDPEALADKAKLQVIWKEFLEVPLLTRTLRILGSKESSKMNWANALLGSHSK